MNSSRNVAAPTNTAIFGRLRMRLAIRSICAAVVPPTSSTRVASASTDLFGLRRDTVRRVRAGTDGCVLTISGPSATREICEKSFTTSKVTFRLMSGTTTWMEALNSRVAPSGVTAMPQLDCTGWPDVASTRQEQRIGRDRSPSSAASRSTSTKLAKADKVKRRASTKPTRRRRES